ncbi:gamma-glutamyl-gamma-aminobutyrate hydrolase [Clostridia bacterium]|nr:gamma-glutamyl-gamma-aminobutyrate hydrolase [Clostridia bacterium]
MKPVIGITPTINEHRYALNLDYVSSLLPAESIPLILPYCDLKENSLAFGSIFDGIVLSGGGDVAPHLYNRTVEEKTESVICERDEFEIKLFLWAVKRQVPVLCICRGLQLMNVAQGGTLCQHVTGHSQSGERNETSHKVNITRETTLYDVYNTDTLSVNSFHHQSIDKLGNNLIVNAVSQDGVLEGVELFGDSFALGVQWHPESFGKGSLVGKIFPYFVEVCKYYAKQR